MYKNLLAKTERELLMNEAIKEEELIKAQELSALIDTSVQTITVWYKWRDENPDNPRAKLLPDYIRLKGGRKTRFWRRADVDSILAFKNSIVEGRGGFMGKVTQRYVLKAPDGKRYIQAAVNILARNNVDPETIDIIKEFLDEEYDNRNAA